MSKNTADTASIHNRGLDSAPKRTRRSAEETRAVILTEADRLFRERGFSNVAISDIASSLAMSPANIFKHFHSKIDLVDAIVQRLVNKMAQELAVPDKSHPPLLRIQGFARSLLENHYADYQQNPYIFELLLLTAKRDLQCGQFYRDLISERMVEILNDARSQGIYAFDDAEMEAETILYMLKGVIHPIAFTFTDIDNLRRISTSIAKYVDCALQNQLA